MPPDLPNEQELILKKRARRRLVGAIALVLLMIIILPQVLQDRALLAQQEPIKITMPVVTYPVSQEPLSQEAAGDEQRNTVAIVSDDKVPEFKEPVTEPIAIKTPENKPTKDVDNKNQMTAAIAPQAEKKVAAKVPEASKVSSQVVIKPQESFTVQVGVYSDIDNVKRLQEQLKQAGFSTHTEKVKTPKGDSLRLKAGNFNSREDAVAALAKIKAIGLSGIVIGNE
jgi:DedD protein